MFYSFFAIDKFYYYIITLINIISFIIFLSNNKLKLSDSNYFITFVKYCP